MSATSSPKKQALDFEEARALVFERIGASRRRLAIETVSLDEAHGRILAHDAKADRDYPTLRRSLRDGFAVCSQDVPGSLRLRGEVRAGDPILPPLNKGEAVEIMTGAPVPDGADAIIMVEHVSDSGWSGVDSGSGVVKVDRLAEPGQFINATGAEAKEGAVLISAGTRLDASHVATLAMIGTDAVTVCKRPKVAILPTGDEIVAVESIPSSHQVRNSNSRMLAASVRACGGIPTEFPITADSAELLDSRLVSAAEYDALIVSGGVSAGKYDLVKPALRKLGVEFHFERVRIQPGQPTAFGTLDGKPVFGLPGNPGSSLITFQLFARLAIELLAGITRPLLPFLSATFEKPFRHKLGLTRFLPALLSEDGQHLQHIPWQGSSDIPALAKANCFLVADFDRESWEAGDSIRVLLKP